MFMEQLTLTQEWDKTFPKSDFVDHRKVTFANRYGITLAADLYFPRGAAGKLPAIAVSGPFGAVKEQCSGLYAQTMAELGFVTLAFDLHLYAVGPCCDDIKSAPDQSDIPKAHVVDTFRQVRRDAYRSIHAWLDAKQAEDDCLCERCALNVVLQRRVAPIVHAIGIMRIAPVRQRTAQPPKPPGYLLGLGSPPTAIEAVNDCRRKRDACAWTSIVHIVLVVGRILLRKRM